MKVELTDQELVIVNDAVEMAIKSARRAQNTSKTPQISEVYKTHEQVLRTIQHKIITGK